MPTRSELGAAIFGALIIILVLLLATTLSTVQAQTPYPTVQVQPNGTSTQSQSAIPLTGSTAQSVCGATYTIVRGDTLSGIAQRCGTTVNALMAANPFIFNPNIIYPGWVLTIPGGTGGIPNTGTPVVQVSPTSGAPGSTITVTGGGFPANTSLQLGLGTFVPNTTAQGQATTVSTVTTDANGAFTTQMTIPPDETVGAQLAVQVTYSGASTTILSNTFTVTSGTTSQARVQISPTTGAAGTMLTVTGSGFPANTAVQVVLGLFTPQAQAQAAVSPATVTTDANGNFTTQVTIPSNATAGAQYAVQATVANQNINAVSNTFIVSGPTNNTTTYTIQSGDTLASIAQKFGTTEEELIELNPNLLVPGQTLVVPVNTGGIPPTGSTITYTVVAGDTLSSIAFRYNTTVASILALNPQITNANLIFPGQVLTIQPNNNVGTGGVPSTGGGDPPYLVQPGDTLYSIARRFNTSVSTLMTMNPQITNPWVIYAGQIISVP